MSDLEARVIIKVLLEEKTRCQRTRNRRKQLGAGLMADLASRFSAAIKRGEDRLRRQMVRPADEIETEEEAKARIAAALRPLKESSDA